FYRLHFARTEARCEIRGHRGESSVRRSFQSALSRRAVIPGYGRERTRHLQLRWNAIGGLHCFRTAMGRTVEIDASEVFGRDDARVETRRAIRHLCVRAWLGSAGCKNICELTAELLHQCFT